MGSFDEVKKTWDSSYVAGTSTRFKNLDAFDRMLDGTIYNKLQFPFSKEFDGEGEGAKYISLDKRRPSVRYDAAKIIVDNCEALTFGEGHAPNVQVFNPFNDPDDDKVKENINYLSKVIQVIRLLSNLDAVMREAVRKGSTGSCGIIIKVTHDDLPFLDVIQGKQGIPVFDDTNPTKLLALRQIYPTTGEKLLEAGYTKEELTLEDKEFKGTDEYFMHIYLDNHAETWMKPLHRDEYANLGEKRKDNTIIRWEPDDDRYYPHDWGFTPAVWIRNLEERKAMDGPCTFGEVCDSIIEIDYLLSQAGRGYKYNLDPIPAFEGDGIQTGLPASGGLPKSPNTPDNQPRTPARAIVAPRGSKVKLLEMQGAGLREVRDHIKLLREFLLEVVSGMKSDQEHSGGTQSGKALEILHQALVWLIGKIRIDYGQNGMVPILTMLLDGFKRNIFHHDLIDASQIKDMPYLLLLLWPEWWLPHGTDLWNTIQALELAAGGSQKAPVPIASMKMIFRLVATAFGLPDPEAAADEALIDYGNWKDEQEKQRQEELKAKAATGGPSGGNSE